MRFEKVLQRDGAVATDRSGYTLVETLIVIVILGIIAVMGMPRFTVQLRHQRINAAANVVAADLETAGALSAQRRVTVELTFNQGTQSYQAATRDSGMVVLRRSLGSRSDLAVPTLRAEPAVVDFAPGGTLSSPLTVTLTDGTYQRRITITRAGLVRVRA